MKKTAKFIKQQFCVMLQQKGFIVSFFFLLTLMLASYINCVLSTDGVDRFQSLHWEEMFILREGNAASLTSIFMTAFPFVILFPFSFSIFKDRQVQMRDIYLSRLSKRTYYVGKSVVCFLGTFLVLAIPLCIQLLMCYVTFDGGKMEQMGEVGCFSQSYIALLQKNVEWSTLFVAHPFIYYLLWIFMVSFIGAVLSVAALGCSVFVKKYMVLVLLPVYLTFEILGRIEIKGHCVMNLYHQLVVSILDNNTNVKFIAGVVIVAILVAVVCLRIDSKKEIG